MSSDDISKAANLLKGLENTEAYRTILEAFPDFIGIIDSEGRILTANRSFINASGLKENELLGVSAFSFVHPEDAKKALRIFKEALESKKVVRGEIRAIIGGNEYVLDVSGRFVDYFGSSFGIVVAKDVTERVKLEKKIREREAFHRNIIDSSISGFLILEKDKIVFANKTVEKITGYSIEEIIGKSVEIFFESQLIGKVRETVERILSGEELDLVTRFLRKDRTERFARVVAKLLGSQKNQILVSFEDITAKREAEKKLEERELLYRTLVESSHTGIFIIQNNKIIYANKILSEILGYSEEDVSKLSHPFDVVSPEYRDIAKRQYWAIESGLVIPEGLELKVQTKDGKEKWMKVLTAKRIKYKGKPAVIVNIADITSLKENEERLRRMNTLLRIAGEINGMLIQENSEFRILSNLKCILEKLPANVGVFLLGSDSIPFLETPEFSSLEFSGKEEIKDVVQELKDGKWYTYLPIFTERLQNLVVLEREENFTEDELRILSTISQNISMRFKALKVEKEKEMARRIVIENLKHFEELADKLRNPLAVIKGYFEIKSEVSEEEFVRQVTEHVEKMERILDELREREMETYELKKILENKKFKNKRYFPERAERSLVLCSPFLNPLS